MKPEKSPDLLQDAPWWLDNALLRLNHKDPIERAAMRRLVAAWDEAGRDAGKTAQAVPELLPYLYGKSSLPLWGATFAPNGSGLRVKLMPDDTRMPRTTRNDTRMRIACVTFVKFLLSESRDCLAGPCKRERCGKYFLIPKGKRRKGYCSPRCCRLDTAARHTSKRREDEHDRKLGVAAELAEKWRTARTKDDWRQWISKQPAGVKAEITSKFLTRAVNHYGLVEPTKER